ncbi:MAG: hypothetical protein KGJ57_10140 [Sphingomonadales bacterium]|nr:hypothetical protein [Sphingomonadales bacterium]MDE2169772.1 hypothetical protein [Sphingomonadales bacterium]
MIRTIALPDIPFPQFVRPALAVFWLLVSAAFATAGDLPLISTNTLNGTAVSLPADLPASRTLVLLAFHHADQAQLARWETGMALQPTQDDWLEIPVVSISNPVIRSMILAGMRGKHHGVAERNHIAPVFGNSPGVAHAFGVTGTQIAAIVIDHQGRAIAHVEGDFDQAKAQILRSAMTGR